MRAKFPTDPCVAGKHKKCLGAEDGSSIYPGDVYLCDCWCHDEASEKPDLTESDGLLK